MKKVKRKADDSGKAAVEVRKSGRLKSGDDDCRCKEVSEKSMPELIRLMLNDLTFRKKKDK